MDVSVLGYTATVLFSGSHLESLKCAYSATFALLLSLAQQLPV